MHSITSPGSSNASNPKYPQSARSCLWLNRLSLIATVSDKSSMRRCLGADICRGWLSLSSGISKRMHRQPETWVATCWSKRRLHEEEPWSPYWQQSCLFLLLFHHSQKNCQKARIHNVMICHQKPEYYWPEFGPTHNKAGKQRRYQVRVKVHAANFLFRDHFPWRKKSLCRIEDSSRRTPNKFVWPRSLYVTISSAPALQSNSMRYCFPRDCRFRIREILNALEKIDAIHYVGCFALKVDPFEHLITTLPIAPRQKHHNEVPLHRHRHHRTSCSQRLRK